MLLFVAYCDMYRVFLQRWLETQLAVDIRLPLKRSPNSARLSPTLWTFHWAAPSAEVLPEAGVWRFLLWDVFPEEDRWQQVKSGCRLTNYSQPQTVRWIPVKEDDALHTDKHQSCLLPLPAFFKALRSTIYWKYNQRLVKSHLSLFCQKGTCHANVAWLKQKQKFKSFLGMWLLVVVSYLWAVVQRSTAQTGHLTVTAKTNFACHTLLTQPQPGVCSCLQNTNLTGTFCFQFVPVFCGWGRPGKSSPSQTHIPGSHKGVPTTAICRK